MTKPGDSRTKKPYFITKETRLLECKVVIAEDREHAIEVANNDKLSEAWEVESKDIEYPDVNEWDWETYHESNDYKKRKEGKRYIYDKTWGLTD